VYSDALDFDGQILDGKQILHVDRRTYSFSCTLKSTAGGQGDQGQPDDKGVEGPHGAMTPYPTVRGMDDRRQNSPLAGISHGIAWSGTTGSMARRM